MRADTLLRFVWVADPQISPDGTRVAFTRVHVDEESDEYRTAIWLADIDGRSEPRPLTTGSYDASPRWSPDGTRLAFTRRAESKKSPQLYVMSMTGGEPARLTDLEKGASSPAWSPDGSRIAFTSGTNPAIDGDKKRKKPRNDPARVITRAEFRWNNEGFVDLEHIDHIWVIGAEGGEARQLTTGDYKEGVPAWSPDGRHILFHSDRRLEPSYEHEKHDILAVPADLTEPTDGAKLESVVDMKAAIYAYTVGKDGRLLATGGPRDDAYRTYEMPRLLLFEGDWPHTSTKVVTADYDYDIGEEVAADQHPPRGGGRQVLAFSEDGKSAYTVATKHGAAILLRVALEDGSVEELTDPRGDVIAGSATPDARRFALTIGDVMTPGDLYVFDAASGKLERLWGPNDAVLAEEPLGQVEDFWYDAHDGRKLHGWIVKPADFDPGKKYPLILQIHGGPHVPYGYGFFHEFRTLADAGYIVLYTNPRGSTSYGSEFANVIQYEYPGDDYKDLMRGVDELISRGYVDENRMGVTGGSGGGLLTNWVVTHTNRFAAAITQRCVSDWLSMWYTCDFAMFTPVWFRKTPYEDPQEYANRSPLHLIEKVETPLMVIHSEEDWRTPIGQGEAVFRALKGLRKPTVMVRFPGENHELSRSGAPSRRIQRIEHVQKWFDHWLRGIDAPEYGVPSARELAGSGA